MADVVAEAVGAVEKVDIAAEGGDDGEGDNAIGPGDKRPSAVV